MIICKQVSEEAELVQILKLQQQDMLKEMNHACPHIIAESNGKVVGYALCMHPQFADTIEVLKPMFYEINKILPKTENYLVMGQICIAKASAHKAEVLFLTL